MCYGRASGGDLVWYRHVGRDDGSFSWDGPRTVGEGWSDFAHVFSGGDGVIYAVTPRVEADVRVESARPASGGDLVWYRHVGRDDGSFSWDGPRTVGKGWSDFTHVFSNSEQPIRLASSEISRFHAENLGVLTVGTPIGDVRPAANGGFEQIYTFGSIVKPLGEPPTIGDRFHVSIEIAGVRCFGTDDDIDGTDEPYIITAVYTIDPSKGDWSEGTTLIGQGEIGDVTDGGVFAQNRQIANNVTVPGDGDIRISLQLWDEEMIGDGEKAKEATSEAVQTGIATALVAIGSVWGPGGSAAGASIAVLAETVGLLDAVGDAVGGAVQDLLGDELLARHDFVIPTSFLQKVRDGGAPTLDKTSRAIPGLTYNFPEGPEDDSWLLDRGKGTYRVFFRVQKV